MKTIKEYLNHLEMCVSQLSGDKNVVEEYASQLEVEFEDFLVTHRLEFHNRSLAEEKFINRLESPETIAESLLGVSLVDSLQLDSSHQLRRYFTIFIVFLAGIVTSSVIFYQFYVFEIPIQFPFFLLIPFLGVVSFGIFLFFLKTISLEKRILTAFSVIVIIIISLAVFHNYIAPTFLMGGVDTSSDISSELSSFHPWAFHSGSGRLHLLFLHEIADYDITTYHYYHTYELDNGSWAPSKKIEQVFLIFDVEPTENGFTIYFGQDIYYQNSRLGYEESYIFASGIFFKIQYNENMDTWSDPVELFRDSHIRDYLKLSDQQIHGYLNSFFLQGDESLFVVWSFVFYGQDVNLTHKYEKTFILSKIDSNGVIDSQPIFGMEEDYSRNLYVRFVEHDDSFYLYTLSYTKRAILFSNGTVSSWYDSLMAENLSETLPLTMFTDHRVQETYEVWDGQPMSVIAKRYLVYYPRNGGWEILDLASENLTVKTFTSPYNIIPVDFLRKSSWIGHRTFDFELNLRFTTVEVFITPIFTNTTIELWEFNYGNTSWRKTGSLDYSPTNHYDQLDEFPIIELIAEGNDWRIFWNQEVSEELHEIFNVTYNSTSDEWSAVIQVTDTETITDDYRFPGSPFPSLLFSFTVINLIIVVLLLKKHRISQ